MSSYAAVKEWRKKNKEKVAAQVRRYRARHPDKVKAVKERYRERSREERLPREAEIARKRRAADPEGNKRRMLAFQARKEAERAAIAGRPRADICELCGARERTVFDHCHRLGHFRGWICDRCNKVLGLVRDDAGLLDKMIEYLERSYGKTDDQTEERIAYERVCGTGTQLSG